ncbi:hypothetical protein [Comamonas sp. UBA7528]|uniref:hypothetical protein n=1 Tax=Comamonas sp. UBA7528 TaxID=1946391 RepID=UPI0025C16DAA|nr:hypothetical protein [Comamonas sp. UBA7528]
MPFSPRGIRWWGDIAFTACHKNKIMRCRVDVHQPNNAFFIAMKISHPGHQHLAVQMAGCVAGGCGGRDGGAGFSEDPAGLCLACYEE